MATLEETLSAVWRQTLVESLKVVTVGADTFSVRSTPKRNLKQVDFEFEGRVYRGTMILAKSGDLVVTVKEEQCSPYEDRQKKK